MWYSLLFVIICSCSGILVQKLYFLVPPTFSLLITSCIATAYFNLINLKKLKHTYQLCVKEWRLWLAIMTVIAIMWYCTMNAPGLIGAAVYNFLYFAWLGTLGFFFLSFKNRHIQRHPLYSGLFSLLLIIALLSDFFWRHGFSQKELIGVALSFIGGTTSFIYFKQTQILTKRISLSATQILASRYFLTIFFMATLTPFQHVAGYITITNVSLLITLSIISLIAPLYCIQKALEKISSEHNAIYVSLTPIVTAFLQEVFFHNVNFHYLIIYILYTLMMVTSCGSKKLRKKDESIQKI